MATEKTLKTRVVQKHDTEANWNKATTFIPKKGEVIVYDPDSTHTYSRQKVGDGIKNINALPFLGRQSERQVLPKAFLKFNIQQNPRCPQLRNRVLNMQLQI